MSEELQIGQSLPNMDLETAEGKGTTIKSHLGPKQTLLYFLHGTWCPECVGQFHLLQRYHPQIKESGAELVVITGEETETLTAFLRNAHPPFEYTVLTDPKRSTYHTISPAAADTVAIIVDSQGIVRWLARWPDHQGEPSYEIIFQALRDVLDASIANG